MPTQTVTIRANWEDRGVGRGTTVAAENMDRMNDAANRVNSAQGRMADAGTRANSVFGRMGPVLVGALSVEAVRRIGVITLGLAKLANQTETTEEAFGNLAVRAGTTATAELEKMRGATRRTLSDLELMQRVGAAVDASLTFDQSITALTFLRRYSLAFGKDFNQLTQTIFTGLARGSTLMLDDAGIIIDASDKIFDGLNEVEKKAALVERAIDLMGEKMETLPEIKEDVITSAAQLSTEWENVKIKIGEVVEGPVRNYLRLLHSAVALVGKAVPATADVQPVGYTLPTGTTLDEAQDIRADMEARRRAAATRSVRAQDVLERVPEGSAFFSERLAKQRHLAEQTVGIERAKLIILGQQAASLDLQIEKMQEAKDLRERPVSIDDAPVAIDPGLVADLDRAQEETDRFFDLLDQFGEEVFQRAGESIEAYNLRIAEIEAGIRTVPPSSPGRVTTPHGARLAELPEPPGPEKMLEQFVRDANTRDFLEGLGGGPDAEAEALKLKKSTLVTISAIESLTREMDFLPDSFQAVTNSATSFARAFTTNNPFDAISAGMSVVSLVAGIFTSRAQRAREIEVENARIREAHHKAQEELNEAIKDAIDLTGRFAGSLASQTDAEVRAQFSSRATTLEQMLGPLNLSIENIIERESAIRKMINQRFQGDDRFDYLYLALNESVTIARTVEERKADAEIAAREEQAEVIIAAIERQREAVLQRLTDAEEAQRAAALRAVGAQYDFIEAELRARYSPQLRSAAGDDAATLVLRERVFADIERIRKSESVAGEAALQGVSIRSSDARERTDALYDGMIQAVRDAIPDMSQPFLSAVAEQTQAFLERWDQGLVVKNTNDFGIEDLAKKMEEGQALTTEDVANLLAYQIRVKSELENAAFLDLSESDIDKLIGAQDVMSKYFGSLSEQTETGRQYGPHPSITGEEAAALIGSVDVILPEGWVSEIPITGSDTVPGGIPVTGSDTVPGGIPITGSDTVPGGVPITGSDTVPGGIPVTGIDLLPDGIPVYVSQEVLDILNRAGTTHPGTNEPLADAPGATSAIDYEAVAAVFRALGVTGDLIERFLADPDAYRTDREPPSRAGKLAIGDEGVSALPPNIIEFPSDMALSIEKTSESATRIADLLDIGALIPAALDNTSARMDRLLDIAEADIAGRSTFYTETLMPDIMAIKSNTGPDSDTTGLLRGIQTLLEDIKAHTGGTGQVHTKLEAVRDLLGQIDTSLESIDENTADLDDLSVHVTVTSGDDGFGDNTRGRNRVRRAL